MTTEEVRGADRLTFRTSQPQSYYDGWRGHNRICRFRGKCIYCGTRTYAFDDGQNDPRGPLGDHAAMEFVADEYEMTGPDVPACFLCQNDTAEKYNAALDMAKRKWQPKS